MKRIKCPKCDNYIIFDDTKYKEGQALVFECPQCGRQFGLRVKKTPQQDNITNPEDAGKYGYITVIENRFHYKQELPLRLGENTIGRYMKGSKTDIPIETNDPSIDITHCVITVSRDKKGKLRYTLKDGPSYTGTFVDNEILGNKEARIIQNGSLFTIGATSIILRAEEEEG